ncbi:MAG: hypothetical protein M0Z31_07770 [Clostridia bacterium]|nr:hypothetical protein [Clostridia bacterium]
MTGILLTTMGLAALFGFFLAYHFFFYRVKLAKPWRWLGAIVGGTVAGGFLAAGTLVLLWPPLNIMMVIGAQVMVVIVTALLLLDKGGNDQKPSTKKGLTGSKGLGKDENRGAEQESLVA